MKYDRDKCNTSEWCGNNIFKVHMNGGEDPTLVFHIDFISSVRYERNHVVGENMIVTIEFYTSKITEEVEPENKLSSPEPKGRKLLI